MSSSLNLKSDEASQVASDLYTHYAKYVIETRALASVFDGMKAVQRRLIYVLSQYPDRLTKSANIVGDTIKYHPHGDSSIYGTLVGMGSPLNNIPIIDTKGNFGGVGVGAAAMRYTECKVSNLGRKLFTQLIEHADYVDGEAGHKEPAYLPVLLPLSLIEGTSGIGVGLAASVTPLNALELTQYYLSVLKNEEARVPRPELGELILNQPREEVENAILTGRGRMKFEGVVHQEGNSKFTIRNLPPDVKIKAVKKKVQRWMDEDKLDFIDESTKTRNYVFKVVSNKLDPKQVKTKLTQAVSRAKTYNYVFSEDEKAIYSGIGYVVDKSLGYLRKCVVRKFNKEHNKAQKLYKVLDAIAYLKKEDRVKDLPQMSRQEVIELIVGFGFSEGTAKEVLSKSISYLTKDHEKEMDELLSKIDNYDDLRNNPDKYIIPLYEELEGILKDHYKDRPVTYYKSEKLDNPKAFINDKGNIEITRDKGVEWDSKLYLVGQTGMTYPRTVDVLTETELIYPDIRESIVGLTTDEDKYILYIIDSGKDKNHSVLAARTDKINRSRNFIRLNDNEKVVKVIGCSTDKIKLTNTKGKKVEVNVKSNLKSRYALPTKVSHRFRI